MSQKVTQENVHLFIPFKVAKITCRIQKEHGIGVKDALLAFYRSPVYHMLETESTKLWHDSGEQIFEEYHSHGLMGKISKKPPKHSILEPYAAQILAWRHHGLAVRTISLKLARLGCETTAQNIWFFLKRHYGQRPCQHNRNSDS